MRNADALLTMKTFMLLLALVVPSAAAIAVELATTLLPPAGAVAPGTEIHLDLLSVNPRSGDVPFAAPATLVGRLTAAGDFWPITLEAVGPAPVAVAPGAFATRRYRLAIPQDASGRAVLELETPEFSTLRAVIEVRDARASPQNPTDPAEPIPSPIAQLGGSATTTSMLARTFAGRFMPNLPIYFVYGSGSEQAAKFQFSFDYRLATLRWGEDLVSTLRLGYTQRSLWDIDASSSPFYDTSYMPEIAIGTDAPHSPDDGSWFTWAGLRAGYQHESNGRDDFDSRSLNRVYLRPRVLLGSLDGWMFLVLPEVHAYVGGVEDNPRIKDYRGYGSLRFYFGRNDGPTLMFTGWAGRDFDHPSYQLDLSVPVRLRRLNIEWFLLMQYFNGYGESLRSYDVKTDALRVGVGLVR